MGEFTGDPASWYLIVCDNIIELSRKMLLSRYHTKRMGVHMTR